MNNILNVIQDCNIISEPPVTKRKFTPTKKGRKFFFLNNVNYFNQI